MYLKVRCRHYETRFCVLAPHVLPHPHTGTYMIVALQVELEYIQRHTITAAEPFHASVTP